jgi:peptidoglycan-associated lipoprotein
MDKCRGVVNKGGVEKMRKQVWLAMLMVVILPFMLFTVSCAKKAVETAPETTPAPTTSAPDAADEEARRARMLEEERLRAEAAAEAAREAFVNENIHFEFDSSAIVPQAQQILNAKAAYMRANPNLAVTIEGHCDERGTDAYNMALGERRAESAKTFLMNLGISAGRLDTISYGEEKPLDPGQSEAAWAKNRRAQFVIE